MLVQELNEFNSICDEFSSGKYILVDGKINSLLKCIENNEKLKNIVFSCLDEYEFTSVFKEEIGRLDFLTHVAVPTEERQLVSLVYNLLYRIQTKTLNLNEFLTNYFANSTDMNEAFEQFSNSLIIPFKNAVNSLFSKKHVIVDSPEYQENYYNKIKTNVNLILDNIDNYKLKLEDKEEFKMILTSLFTASDKNDKKLVFTLMIALNYFAKFHKKVRPAYLTLEDCFEK